MNQFTFRPQGVCSQLIEIETALLKGMTVENAIDRLSGIRCGFKDTSCPDQLSRALKAMQEQA